MNEETTNILIDTAMASGSATALDPEERALQELVLTIRDDAATPAADFRLRMDARVAAGFPARRARRVKLPAFAVKRPTLTALGAAASMLIALVIAGSLGGGDNEQAKVASSRQLNAPAAQAAPSAKSVKPASGAEVAGGAGSALQQSDRTAAVAPSVTSIEPPIAPPVPSGDVRGGSKRRVERSAQLVLAAPRDKFSDVSSQILAVTDRYRGIVMHSSVTDTATGQPNGSFDLRIPVRNLQPALRDLSQLADVQSRTENADDVTASFVSARTRIQELRAERRRLLLKLAKTTSDIEAAAIRAQIRIVNAKLDAQTHELALMARRTSLATVAVTLTAKQGGSGGGGGLSNGANDLKNSLIDSANLALRVLGVAIPIAILIALFWGANAWTLRRRREAALDQQL